MPSAISPDLRPDLRSRSSLVDLVKDYDGQLLAAKKEADDLRGQLRKMAALAAESARSLQQELQDELAEMTVQQEAYVADLEVAEQQIKILVSELRDAESQEIREFSIEAMRAKIRQNRQCRQRLRRWHELSKRKRDAQRLARVCVATNLTADGRAVRRCFNSWEDAASVALEQRSVLRRALAAIR